MPFGLQQYIDELIFQMKLKQLPFLISWFIFGLSHAFAQQVLPLPYIIEGACPFECCTYGDWSAEERIPVYSSQGDTSQLLFHLENGVTFQALTGNVVVLETGLVGVHESYELYGYYSPENNSYLKKPIRQPVTAGDTLLVLNYLGEGEWNVWFQGNIYQEDGMKWRFGRYPEDRPADEVPATLVKQPETEWWVKIETPEGKEGWILMKNAKVSGNDACG